MNGVVNRLVILFAGLLTVGAAAVEAAPANQQIISKQEAMEQAQEKKQGRVLSIKLRDKPPAPPTYRVKILNQGEVHMLNIDARRSRPENPDARARSRR